MKGTAYNPVFGPNSNSVAYTLLLEIGITVPAITMTTVGFFYGRYTFVTTPAGTLTFDGLRQYFTGWGQDLN